MYKLVLISILFSMNPGVPYAANKANNTQEVSFLSKAPPITHNHHIRNVDFRGMGKQAGRVILLLSDSHTVVEVNQAGDTLKLRFMETKCLKRLTKTIDVGDFHTPVQTLTSQQEGVDTLFLIRNRGDYGYFTYQVNKQYIIDIYPLSSQEIKLAKLKKNVYTGKLISLNFQSIQIKAVLQLLAEFTGINMVVSDSVKGDITLRLKDTPWDQALAIILQTNGLDKRRTGNVMLIAPSSELLQREKDALKSQIEVTELLPLRARLLQLNFSKATDMAVLLKDKNTSLLSTRGSLSVDARTNTLWIQDTNEQIDRVVELIKRLDVPVKQVLIESRIVNVSREAIVDLGLRFGVSTAHEVAYRSNDAAQTELPSERAPLGARLNVDFGSSTLNPASIGIALATLGENVLLDLELSALESEDRAEIIASPRLMTTNQQPAMIESGEEIPYQESNASGATSVSFKKAVLSLKVTPHITPDNNILMDLQINQDSPSGREINGVPAILTKKIQTNVLINDGQTVVLGGIYKQDKNNTVNRVPFLSELPLLGVLFRDKHTRVRDEELLIFITPTIITDKVSAIINENQDNAMVKKTVFNTVNNSQKPWKQ